MIIKLGLLDYDGTEINQYQYTLEGTGTTNPKLWYIKYLTKIGDFLKRIE